MADVFRQCRPGRLTGSAVDGNIQRDTRASFSFCSAFYLPCLLAPMHRSPIICRRHVKPDLKQVKISIPLNLTKSRRKRRLRAHFGMATRRLEQKTAIDQRQDAQSKATELGQCAPKEIEGSSTERTASNEKITDP